MNGRTNIAPDDLGVPSPSGHMEGRGAGDAMAFGDVAPKLVQLGHHVVIAKPSCKQQRPVM